MQILYIHQYFYTLSEAIETHSYEFGRRLVAAEHVVTILCGKSHLTDVPDEVEGMRVICIPVQCSNRNNLLTRTWRFLIFALRATWTVLRLDYDLVLATLTPLTVGMPALAARLLRKKIYF